MSPNRYLVGFVAAIVVSLGCQAAPETLLPMQSPDPWLGASQPSQTLEAKRADCFLGVVVASEYVELAAPFSERVRRLRVGVGDVVSEGDVLLELDSLEAERLLELARESHQEAQAVLQRAVVDFSRATEKARRANALEGLLSQDQIESARHEQDYARAVVAEATSRERQRRISLARSRVRLLDTQVRAPFSGRIAAVHSFVGVHVVEGAPLVAIIGTESLRVKFAVPAARAQEVQLGQKIRFDVPSQGATRVITVDAIAPALDSATQMLFAESLLPDSTPVEVLDGTIARLTPDLSSPQCTQIQLEQS